MLQNLLKSMQNASCIIDICLEYQEISEIFENFKKRQSSTFNEVQDSSFSIKSKKIKQKRNK